MNDEVSAPAGWYPYRTAGELCWWDGSQWTEHRHVAVSLPPPVVSSFAPSTEDIATRTAASWCLALLPLLTAVITLVLIKSELPRLALFPVLVLASLVLLPASIVLSLWDLSTLRSRGASIPRAHVAWVLLGAWVYLLIRAILLKTSDRERWVVLAVNLSTGVVVGVALLATFVSVWQDQDFRRNIFYDQASIERSIQTGIREQLGDSVDVECPSKPLVGIGDTFTARSTTHPEQPLRPQP